ncbi:MAG: nucleotide exchange factor GrpE [Deltaproteobacteria bacterium]|nr:nucleotide exchange factor GrpE [Deltaproteobacteria bacterium]
MPDEDPDRIDSAESNFDAAEAAAEFAAAMGEEPLGSEAPTTGSDKYTALLEEEVESLKALLAENEHKLLAAQNKATSAAAEVDRARTRIEASAASTIERKRRSVLSSFLDVADAVDRAVDALASGGVAPALAQGVAAVQSELRAVFSRNGARHRPALGQPFDPAHHEAIATAPATADSPAGTITAVLGEGYDIGDETLRAARVVVAKD